jgi:hypothetical protein
VAVDAVYDRRRYAGHAVRPPQPCRRSGCSPIVAFSAQSSEFSRTSPSQPSAMSVAETFVVESVCTINISSCAQFRRTEEGQGEARMRTSGQRRRAEAVAANATATVGTGTCRTCWKKASPALHQWLTLTRSAGWNASTQFSWRTAVAHLAYCTRCGSIFEARRADVTNAQMEPISNMDTSCPVCGGFSRRFGGTPKLPKIPRRNRFHSRGKTLH